MWTIPSAEYELFIRLARFNSLQWYTILLLYGVKFLLTDNLFPSGILENVALERFFAVVESTFAISTVH